MGIEAFSLRMLCEAKLGGAAFDATLTLGRQNLSLRKGELGAILDLMGRSGRDPARTGASWAGIADGLLTDLLEIRELVSVDCSAYEGASLVHDMNQPVSPDQWGAYDAVLDTGTLEHVFNFPVAVASCMRMLKPGGRYFGLVPANNHCGHGFYQFSPELFFRLFNGANGFELEHLLAVEHPFPGIELSTRRTVYSVRDPAELGTRVGLVSRRPVYLFIQAVKRADVELFSPYPQQSDYVTAWHGGPGQPPAPRRWSAREALASAFWRLQRGLPAGLGRLLLGCFQRYYRDTFRNRRAYRKWTPPPGPDRH